MAEHDLHRPFRRLSGWLHARYGERIYKVSLRGGFTCPNRDGTRGRGGCSFCAGAALQPTGFAEDQSIAEQLARGIDYVFARHGAKRVIAYYQDYSATYAPIDCLEAIYAPALADKRVVGLAVGTRPDCLPPPVLDYLQNIATHRDLWLELGLQIADDALLASMGRGHDVATFVDAVRACHAHGLRLCVHVIVGLPGVRFELERRTLALLAELGVWGVKLHGFHVLRGSRLEAEHARQPLPLLDREAYVDRIVDLLEGLPPEMIVHRVTGEAPRKLTIAPEWSVNKIAVFDAVIDRCEARQTWQGRRYAGYHGQDVPAEGEGA